MLPQFLKLNPKRIISLDIIRGIAIILVVLSHNPVYPEARPFFYWPIVFMNEVGWMGVDLFFVLSGYLVGGLLMKELKRDGNIQIKRFLIRRGFKIWPVYYVFLLAFLFFQTFFYNAQGNYLASFSDIFSKLLPAFFHLQNYFESTSIIGWFWSLGVEEHFYLTLPAVIVFAAKRLGLTTKLSSLVTTYLLFCVTIIGFRALTFEFVSQNNPYSLVFPSHLRFDGLFSGVFLAFLKTFFPENFFSLKKIKSPLLLLGVLLVSTPYFFSGKQVFLYPFGMTILYIGFSFIVLFAAFDERKTSEMGYDSSSLLRKAYLTPLFILAFIGEMSFSIYVWHGFWAKPIAHRICQTLGLEGHHLFLGPLNELVYVAVPIGLGISSYLLIEKPFLRLREKLHS